LGKTKLFTSEDVFPTLLFTKRVEKVAERELNYQTFHVSNGDADLWSDLPDLPASHPESVPSVLADQFQGF